MMFYFSLLRRAGSIFLLVAFTIAHSLERPRTDGALPRDFAGRSSDSYIATLGGSGEGWPSVSQWIPFTEMFQNNKAIIKAGCVQFGANKVSDEEMSDLSSSIQSVATFSGVDARFILAIVLQESNGCVRVGTTNNGVSNPGLMQSHGGIGSCGNNKKSPCPKSIILQMIKDGTEGTSSGDGLKQCLVKNGGSGATAYYRAARCYNSGSVATSGNLGQGGSTHCYASDVANRLLGWSSGPSTCNEATVGSLSDTQSAGSSSIDVTSLFKPTSVPAKKFTHSTLSSLVTTQYFSNIAQWEPSTASTGKHSSTSCSWPSSTTTAAVYPYTIATCLQYATVGSDDYCQKIETAYGISAVQLRDWNPGLDEACTNLWCGYRYCVKA